MLRNVVLIISTLAVLALLFVGYLLFLGRTPGPADRPVSGVAALPQTTQVAEERKLEVQGVGIEPGEKMGVIRYDEFGRPTDYFRCENWEKVPGTRDEVLVVAPELVMRLPSGMIATITAARGQISAARLDGRNVQPKLGWLAGDARIVIDRATGLERTPLSQRPEDQITIEMERLQFDLEIGELKTDQPLRVTSPDFEVSGTGLHLLWNESDNRVEKLLIDSAGEMVLRGALLTALGGALERQNRAEQPAPLAPASAPASPPGPRPRPMTAYRCEFSGGVTVDQFVAADRAAGLVAERLVLTFDVGARGEELAPRAPATAPASQPEAEPSQRIVVRWGGRLELGPDAGPPDAGQPRRHFEASGDPVRVDLPSGSVCGSRMVLHAETQRLWLYPTREGRVALRSGDRLAVDAATVYADLRRNLVKLIGDVRFCSRETSPRQQRVLAIDCNLWAELHLAERGAPAAPAGVFDNPLTTRAPRSAVFVGDVRVDYQEQTLRAQRLEAFFRQERVPGPASRPEAAAAPGDSAAVMQSLLESAVATGDVHLVVADPPARRSWRRVFERSSRIVGDALRQALVPHRSAAGAAPARDADRTLTCASLRLEFDQAEQEVYVRRMQGAGAVEVFDRGSRFAARGQRVTAGFLASRDLDQASVVGTPASPALVRARDYALRGAIIRADNGTRTLSIDGPSRLVFRSRRSLQGLTRSRPERITVTSEKGLRIDEPKNTIRFAGNVVASTGDEELLADTLTLLLEDVRSGRRGGVWSEARSLLRALRGALPAAAEARRDRPAYALATASRDGERKELARVLARNAEMRSVTRVAGDPQPLVYQSVAAPEVEIDVSGRWIRTVGQTVLGMTDRRLRGAAEEADVALGLPSALIDRGPSQTVMRCGRGLLYALGAEGPQRRDSVLLEGGVVFRRVTGAEMASLEQMLPDLAADPRLRHTLKSRNTYLECGRLEVMFVVEDDPQRSQAALRPGAALQLSLLNAVEDVYLRDQQDQNVREVYAHQLEFDRPGGVIRVLGLPERGIDARVYDENPATGRLNMPARGPELTINLDTNTIRSGRIRGQVGGGTR